MRGWSVGSLFDLNHLSLTLQMSGLIDALNKGLRLLKHGDDDFFDRLSSRYSVAICIVFAVVVSTGKYNSR